VKAFCDSSGARNAGGRLFQVTTNGNTKVVGMMDLLENCVTMITQIMRFGYGQVIVLRLWHNVASGRIKAH